MVVVDANLLIYASSEASPFYPAASDWLVSVLSADEPVRMPWSSIHAFLRVATHPSLSDPPMTSARTVEIVHSWLSHPNVTIIEPGPNYWPILHRLVLETPARGNLITDAHLAALAIEHDATVYTTDRDFRRFRGVRVTYPL